MTILLQKHLNSNIYSLNFTKLHSSENIAPGLFIDHSRAYQCLKFVKHQSKYFYTMFNKSRLPRLLYLTLEERTFRERKVRVIFFSDHNSNNSNLIGLMKILLLAVGQRRFDVLKLKQRCVRYLSNVEVVSKKFLVIPCNYIFRLSKEAKT